MEKGVDSQRKLQAIASINIFVLVLGKILVWHSSWEILFLITAPLWFFIFRGKNVAVVMYKVVAVVMSLFGILGFILIFPYLYRKINILPCIVTFIIGLSYFVSLRLLRNR